VVVEEVVLDESFYAFSDFGGAVGEGGDVGEVEPAVCGYELEGESVSVGEEHAAFVESVAAFFSAGLLVVGGVGEGDVFGVGWGVAWNFFVCAGFLVGL
jgi:hypothetical protein